MAIGDRFAIPAGLSALARLTAKPGRPRAALMLAGAAAVEMPDVSAWGLEAFGD